jgi:hypothetical protein
MMEAEGELGEGVTCSVKTGKALVTSIRLSFDLDTDADEEQLATLLELT